MTAYALSGLTKIFGVRTVLDIPDLTIDDGYIYALLGPNGAGKTTLLNILGFLDHPTSGNIHFNSKSYCCRYERENLRRKRDRAK